MNITSIVVYDFNSFAYNCIWNSVMAYLIFIFLRRKKPKGEVKNSSHMFVVFIVPFIITLIYPFSIADCILINGQFLYYCMLSVLIAIAINLPIYFIWRLKQDGKNQT